MSGEGQKLCLVALSAKLFQVVEQSEKASDSNSHPVNDNWLQLSLLQNRNSPADYPEVQHKHLSLDPISKTIIADDSSWILDGMGADVGTKSAGNFSSLWNTCMFQYNSFLVIWVLQSNRSSSRGWSDLQRPSQKPSEWFATHGHSIKWPAGNICCLPEKCVTWWQWLWLNQCKESLAFICQ